VKKPVQKDEPLFMKYMRDINMDFNNKEYLQGHFDEDDDNAVANNV